jgi:chromosome segregation protein
LTGILEKLNARQNHLHKELTEQRVRHAQAIEQRQRIAESIHTLERSIEQMGLQQREAVAEAQGAAERLTAAQDGIKAARAQIEEHYARRLELEKQATEIEQTRQGLTERIEEIRTALVEQRRAHDELTAQISKRRVAIGEVDVRVENLISRAAEELNLDVVAAYAAYTHDDSRDWPAVDQEIQELRGKIQRLGNVNLDAISEQDELEQRESFLAGQLKDIDDSRRQLAELILKLNDQCRELFSQALRRRQGGCAADRPERCAGKRHRDHRPPARQGAAQYQPALRRREDDDHGGAAVFHLPRQAQPVLHPGRGGRRPG